MKSSNPAAVLMKRLKCKGCGKLQLLPCLRSSTLQLNISKWAFIKGKKDKQGEKEREVGHEE